MKQLIIVLVSLLFYNFEKCINDYIPNEQINISENSEDNCVVTNQIKKTIIDFFNSENELIYEDTFISLLVKNQNNAQINYECSFFHNNENNILYYSLSDSLLKKTKHDERAMKLLVNSYLINSTNIELTEYYSTIIIPNAAIANITTFVKFLSDMSEREMNRCIYNLDIIDNKTDIENIITTLKGIKNSEYQVVVNKVIEKLQ